MRTDPLQRMWHALRNWFARRTRTPLEIIAWRPLHGGAALYVADIDGRRLVFAAAPNAVCLLASYASATESAPDPCADSTAPGALEELASGCV